MSCLLFSARRLVLAMTALVSLVALAPWASAADRAASSALREARAVAPANDTFGAAQILAGTSGDVASTNADATKEAGEPAHAGNAGGASVWFRLTPDRIGRVTVLTRQVTFDTLLAVYSGTDVASLTEVASNDDYGTSRASRVAFPVVPGTEYFIAVDGLDGVNGPFTLRWRQGPQNDDFADATPLEGLSGAVAGNLYGATSEPGEPLHGAGATAWYRWVAPDDGKFMLRVDGAPVATAYSGASVDSLTTLASGTVIVFDAAAATQYSFAVEGGWNDTSGFELRWGRVPLNDGFAGAQVLVGSTGTVLGTDAYATAEPDERVDYGSNTVWYSWTASSTGHVRFETRRETLSHDTVLSVWEGTSVDALSLVAQNDDFLSLASALSFEATAGTIYFVRVSGYWDGAMGEFDLDWYPGAIIFGTSSDNVINGTPGSDYIDGFTGRDVIRGGAGDDVINGSEGADRLFGQGGDDSVVGGSGRDLLSGGAGNDHLNSRDRVRGNDAIYGGPGRDTVRRDRWDLVHQVP